MRFTLITTGLFLATRAAAADGSLDAAGSLVQMLLGLAVVIGLLYASLHVLKRLGAGGGNAAGLIKVRGATAVGPRERVVLVDVAGKVLVLGVTPTLRLRPDGGSSAWFWEAGIGATLADQRYHPAGQEEFSTRFNFASHLGIGINFGARRQHELLLRLQHVSNAGIKKPNPGVEFLQLRYAWHF